MVDDPPVRAIVKDGSRPSPSRHVARSATSREKKAVMKGKRRGRRGRAALCLLGLVAGTAPAVVAAAAPAAAVVAGPDRSVVVVHPAGEAAAAVAAQAVRAAGGTVTHSMPAVGALVADVPESSIPAIRAAAGVSSVTADGAVQLLGNGGRQAGAAAT